MEKFWSDHALAMRDQRDSSGVPAVWLNESDMMMNGDAPGYTRGESRVISSSPPAVSAPARRGNPRSSAPLAFTRDTAQGARGPDPAGGGVITSATKPAGDACHDTLAPGVPEPRASSARTR